MSILIEGKLRITTINAKTGKILNVDEGSNLLLKTGVLAIARLITGETRLPTEVQPPALPSISGQKLIELDPMKDIIKYFQFGTNSSPVTYGDVSFSDNGTLDPNLISPSGASPVLPVETSISEEGTIRFTCTLLGDQGNLNGAADTTYTEAVLMGLETVNPIKYNWIARRVFSGKIKNPDLILRSDWFMNFKVEEQVS